MSYFDKINVVNAVPNNLNANANLQVNDIDNSVSNPAFVQVTTGTALIGKVGIDQTTDGTTNKVVATQSLHDSFNANANVQVNNTDVSSSNPVPVKSNGSQSSTPITRPNDTALYAIGDVVGSTPASNLVFNNVTSTAGSHFIILGLSLRIDASAIPTGMSGFRLHLYDSNPTEIVDNSVFNLIANDRDKYLGYIEIDAPQDLGDTLYVSMENINKKRKLANGSTTLYGMLETRGAYVPTAQTVKTVKLHIVEV